MSINDKIIQIMPILKPLVAVFKDSENNIFTEEIYAFALIETENRRRYIRGVEAAWDEIGYPEWDNFLGYAKDKKKAYELYGEKEQSDDYDDRFNRAKKAVMEYQEIVNSIGVSRLYDEDKLIDDLCKKYNVSRKIFESQIRTIEDRILGAKPWTKADCPNCRFYIWKRLSSGGLGEWCNSYLPGNEMPLEVMKSCPNGYAVSKELKTPFPMD